MSQPHPVDQHVGQRIRARRRHLQISQSTLGGSLGLTFQQIQKYERGANRVSASKLYDISNVLGVPIGYFFADLAPPQDNIVHLCDKRSAED